MLTDIFVKNYTIADTLDLSLHNAFNVFTGETGAGKSIIIDAIALGLGARADSKCIRPGQKQCDICLSFDVSNLKQAQQWLQDNDVADDNNCMIRRIITQEGKSKSSINGTPCPQSLIKQLAPLLLNIHGQHQNQALLKNDNQRICLDRFAGNKKPLAELKHIVQSWQATQRELNHLKDGVANYADKLEFANYQIQELDDAKLQKNEWQTLFENNRRMQGLKDSLEQLQQAQAVLDDDNGATQLVQQALKTLNSVTNKTAELNTTIECLEQAGLQLDAASQELQQQLGTADLDPEALQNIEQRLAQLHDLARKHHTEPEQLHERYQQLVAERDALLHSEENISALESKLRSFETEYQVIADKISAARNKAAKKLHKLVSAEMEKLGMPGGVFKINFSNNDTVNLHGNESVEFMVSTNPGHPLQAMNKVVSGGELSRISLALEVLTEQKQQELPTLIFDEVDTGIGGKTANIIGDLLKQLGAQTQVICITHLPQVAAAGNHHYSVSKEAKQNTTLCHINELNNEERVYEIARMQGGTNVSKQALKSAEELLNTAQ